MPTRHFFSLGQKNGKWLKPENIRVHVGDSVIWQIPTGVHIEFQITGNGNPFESFQTGVFTNELRGKIRQDATGIKWKYTLEYRFFNTHFIIDPKIKVKPSSGGLDLLAVILIIGATTVLGFFGKRIYKKIKALF